MPLPNRFSNQGCPFFALFFALFLAFFLAVVPCPVMAQQEDLAMPDAKATDSKFLEKELQSLDWAQFRFVLHSVPQLRAEVDAYGPLGWQYVERHYRRYGWSRSLDKLDQARRRELADLIVRAKAVTR
ncbi:MAG: hypothetical protein WBH99_11080 [Azovibrio sp.]|uniref:hypothetical protein n=1 Tax=Azovibrio sp. TaxID=1872673 RepID=UPI003C712568